MKKAILLILVAASFTVEAQTLKDLLYSGKLKNDSGSVVRKNDDLSTKIDTTTKKKAVEQPKSIAAAGKDSSVSASAGTQSDSGAAATDNSTAGNSSSANATNAPKDNNVIWKQFIDSSISTWKTEVLPNKKIKSGTYYILVEYEIGTD